MDPTIKNPKTARKNVYFRKRPETRREEILEAALTVFAEKGFAAAHMQEIARQASITVVTIYEYFKSKEEIFKSLIESSVGSRIQYLSQLAKDYEGSSSDLICMIVRAIGTFMRTSNRAVLPKLILAETGNFPELARFYRREVTDRGLGLFEDIVRRGIERHEFRAIDPKHGARLILVPVVFTAIWSASFGKFDNEPYDFEGFVETHLDLILRGMATEKTPGSDLQNR